MTAEPTGAIALDGGVALTDASAEVARIWITTVPAARCGSTPA